METCDWHRTDGRDCCEIGNPPWDSWPGSIPVPVLELPKRDSGRLRDQQDAAKK